MKTKKHKMRIKLLKAFSVVLFFSFLCTGVIFNIAVRFRVGGDYNFIIGQHVYAETTGILGRVGWLLFILTGVMFIVALIVTYFLANSITRPIEKLSKFALDIGGGNFTLNHFKFNEKELEDLNIALNKSAKQLSIYDNEQKAFFQNASHELRTPLMSIKCYAEGIAFGIMDSVEASETILQETDKLSELVADILYISKLDNITTTLTAEKTNLVELIRDSAARQEAVAEKRHVRFSLDFGQDVVTYECISELFSRVIDNLISNAIRYADSEIVLSCHKKASHIEICVADDGDGIEPELLPHVFERFCKGKNGNHGIGLAIVKSIVAQQGGSVSAKNSSKGGAVFIIMLPI